MHPYKEMTKRGLEFSREHNGFLSIFVRECIINGLEFYFGEKPLGLDDGTSDLELLKVVLEYYGISTIFDMDNNTKKTYYYVVNGVECETFNYFVGQLKRINKLGLIPEIRLVSYEKGSRDGYFAHFICEHQDIDFY